MHFEWRYCKALIKPGRIFVVRVEWTNRLPLLFWGNVREDKVVLGAYSNTR